MSGSRDIRQRLILSVFLIVILYIIGTFFYHRIEGWSHIDSVYFLTATFTTIGYGDVVPITTEGKMFTIVIAWVGISLGFFLLYSMMEYRETAVDSKLVGKLRFFRDFFGNKKRKGE